MTTTSLVIKRSIKSAASIAKAGLGFPRVASGSINIFAYHRVVADIAKAERDAIYGIVISRSTFRRHCEMIKSAFDVVSLETAMHFLDKRRQVARPMAAITFDDGYLDFYEEAFPVLNDLALPATVFLPTDCIGQDIPLAHDRLYWLLKLALQNSLEIRSALRRAGLSDESAKRIATASDLLKRTDILVYQPAEVRERVITELEIELGPTFAGYPKEYRLLDWEMVSELSQKGINFGGHTANHVVLPLEHEDVMRAEIFRSKAELDARLGRKVVSFAYPNGEHNAHIRSIAAEAGYTVAVTTENRVNRAGADLLALGRTSLCEESTRGIAGEYSPRVANLRLGT